ncbi:hypothetical protein M011DRAFT_466987 [Sporormia fimetaria CBS 119925]|uniref:Inositol hexakisphosphate and diphosphoinositol-pentakisphosphate kinase n=1 Tax=Sporormia fimetaria CBS 119925 TaxID=1340428 RepID=A0A6A6VFS0_9PLEO|nr:hypothetical protein M011DRAFT_466987 [Sporormia fimetaria CBS 119925]
MEQLSRTISSESTRSRPASHVLVAGHAPDATSRKARTVEPETGAATVERTSVSMPPPASKSIPRQFPLSTRRPSKASDSYFPERDAGGPLRNGSTSSAVVDDTDTTPTLEASRRGSIATSLALALPDTAFSSRARTSNDQDADSHRMSFSSLYSLGSVIMSSTRGLSGPGSAAGSEPEVKSEAAVQAPTTTATSSFSVTTSTSSQPGNLALSVNTPAATMQPAPASSPQNVQPPNPSTKENISAVPNGRSRSRTQRRISGSAAHSSSPGARDTREQRPTKGIIGVCALESKARSKPARNIFGKLVDEFEVKIFGDKIILDEDVENWPVCDFLISFFSDGFPLDKAIAYARLRKPFCVNDLPMQQVLWDRRLCLQILDKLKVPTPRRVEVTRDGGPHLKNADFAKALHDRTGVKLPGPPDGTGGGVPPPKSVELSEDGNTLCVDGQTITKPFVEKPVSGEDHNINIYYHTSEGGGGRRLFRKVNNKSSAKDETLNVPRSILEPGSSYIYEQFLTVENSEDVKAYTVGPNFCHAETRKSPVVDGLVKRNPSGKEVRYVTKLSDTEAAMASKISEGFGQRVCGFDLLRTQDRSYVIDVNGWSFVKDNSEYYDKAAMILKEMFLKEIARKEKKEGQAVVGDTAERAERNGGLSRKNTASHREALKGMFKSPSMSKLSHIPHPHLRSSSQANNNPSSPEASISSTPMVSPLMEKSYGAAMSSDPSIPKSESDLLLGSKVRSNEQHEDEKIEADEAEEPDEAAKVPPPASKAQWKLKGVVSVIRHADRTPKQKFKYTFHSKPFVDLLKGHQEEVLLIGEAALQSVSDAVKLAMDEGIEDQKKLRELQVYLNKKGSWPGTKVQIKPMFRKRRKEELLPGQELEEAHDSPDPQKANSHPPEEGDHGGPPQQQRSDSMSGVTLSRISAVENNLILDKLQLIIKWGGEPTHSARYQSQDMAANFRNDLLLMNREVLDDVSIFSSSERRVTTSAQIFATTFLNDANYAADNIQIRKDLLDDSNAAKDVMDKVKKKLKTLLRAGDKAPPQFVWPKDTSEPYLVVRQVVDLMKFHQRVMNHNYKKIESGAVSSLSALASGGSEHSPTQSKTLSQIQKLRWCCNEGPELFRERWEKLFKEFSDADKVDPSKISELYDSMKFDALHNRQFLEWVFTPDATFLDENAVADNVSEKTTIDTSVSEATKSEPKEKAQEKGSERASIAERIGLRRRSEMAVKAAAPFAHESYWKPYTGPTPAATQGSISASKAAAEKAQTDARLAKLREMYHLCKVLFDYIGPQEYGIDNSEKLEIGLLTSLPLLKEIVEDLEELQASDAPKCFFYFTKESHIYTLLNCILEGGIKTKIERNAIPELDYLSQIGFELYESENAATDESPNTFNYSIRITLSPGCHAFAPLDVQLDSRHMIGFSPRRSLTAHHDWKEVLQTLRAKFHTVKLPKSFVAINLSEKVPGAFGLKQDEEKKGDEENEGVKEQAVPLQLQGGEHGDPKDVPDLPLPSPALEPAKEEEK